MHGLQDAKLVLMAATGLAKDALHVHVGLLVFFGAAALWRWPIGGWRPWLMVLAAALAGEVWDIADTMAAHDPLRLAGNWQDVWNTMLWPTATMMLARWTRVLARR